MFSADASSFIQFSLHDFLATLIAMFSQHRLIKCENEIHFDRIPETYLEKTNNLCETESQFSQSTTNMKNVSPYENLCNKSGQCEYYFKNVHSISLCGHTGGYVKTKFEKTNHLYFGKVHSNSIVNDHGLMNIDMEDAIQYPVDESINYEFDIPLSLSPRGNCKHNVNAINSSNSEDNDNGKCVSFHLIGK